MQKKPHILRRVRRFVFYSTAGIIVVFAVLMSALRVIVSEADSWRMELQQLGTHSLERQVYINALDARLDGLTPVLVVKKVRLMSLDGKTELFSFNEGTLTLDIIGSIRTQTFIPTGFTIQGAELTVVRHKDKSFSFRGMELKSFEDAEKNTDSSEFSNWLFQRDDLNIQDSSVIWIDQFRNQPALRLENVNLHLHNEGDHHQLKASVNLPETLGRSFEVALDAHGKVAMNPSNWRGKIYLRGSGIQPTHLRTIPAIEDYQLIGGVTDFELWGEWNKGQLEQLSGELTAYNLLLQHPEMQQNLRVKLLSGLFDYQFTKTGWMLDVNRFQFVDAEGGWLKTSFGIQQSFADNKSAAKHIQVKAKQFRLENISSLLLRSALLSEQQTEMLVNMAPSGDVENFQLGFSNDPDNRNFNVQANFSQLGFSSWEELPGARGLGGSILGAQGQITFNLESDYAVFDFPWLFREPLKISSLSGMFGLQRYQQGWQLSTDSLLVKNEDAETQSRLLLDIPDSGSSALMDLQVQFKNGNAAHISRYLPVTIMSSGLVDWLDRGIVSGRVIQGGAIFRGRLADFPFRQNDGQFRVEFEAENASVDYLEGWPAIDDGYLKAVFTDRGMDIQAESGRIFDSRLSTTSIRIEDFEHANLLISGEVDGELKDTLRFLVESPIQPEIKPLLDSFHYHGRTQLELELSIPLNDEVKKTQPLTVKGQVQLVDAELLMLDDLIDITAINGNIAFTQDTQTATDIRALIMGGKASIDIATGSKSKDQPVIIKANGKVDSRHLAKKFGLPAWQQINGMAELSGELSIQHQSRAGTKAILKISSQLQGVEVNLPQPLAKEKNEQRDSTLEVFFTDNGKTTLYARSKDYVSAAVVLDTTTEPMRPSKAYVHFGKGEGHLPKTESLKFSGSLSMFSLTPWLDALKQGRDEVTHSFVSLPLIFDMASLQLAAVADDENASAEESSVADIDVDQFPLIQGSINELFYDDVAIGRLDINTSRLKFRKGIQLDSLTLQGEELAMQASGEWVQWPGRDVSSMEVKLTSPDLGKMLSSLGFSAIFQGGETTLEGRLNWPNSPIGLSLSELESKLKYTVTDGSIVSVEPGAGRLLGLFSLAALPRRLILDFSDAFGDGLYFDSIDGELDVHDGSVFMDNNLMKSPLAHITVSGRTGLVDRDFDQLITVKPRGGDALTAVAGGMIFGPQIGAAILLLQKIIGNELQDATAIKYKVSGSWEKPQIIQLGKPEEAEESSIDDVEF